MTPERLLILILVIVIAGLLVVIYRLRRESRRIWLGLDEVAEDTLKALHNLSSPLAPGTAPDLAGFAPVRSTDLVRQAELQPERLPMILAEMQRREWVVVDGEWVTLLLAGEKRAIELIRAHRLWERYLAEKEGLALDALHEEATRREHRMTPEEIDRLDARAGLPALRSARRPHSAARGQPGRAGRRRAALALAGAPHGSGDPCGR